MRPPLASILTCLVFRSAFSVHGQVEPLHTFPAVPPGPFYPNSELIVGSDGAFYGSASGGGLLYKVTAAGVVSELTSYTSVPPAENEPFSTFYAGQISSLQARIAEGPPGQFIKFFDYGGSKYKGYGAADGLVYFVNTTAMPDAWSRRTYQPMFLNLNVSRFPLGGIVNEGNGSFLGSALGGDLGDPVISGGFAPGTIFRFAATGRTTLASFAGTDAINGMPIRADHPRGALAKLPDGSIWGTATSGAVFKVVGSGLHIVHYFSGGADGGTPLSGLVLGPDGNFYGTTSIGGAFNGGTVFKVTPTGESGTLTTLASFDAATGTSPGGSLGIGDDGSIYGVTGIVSAGENKLVRLESDIALKPGKIFKLNLQGNITVLADPNARMAGGLTPVGDGSFVGAMSDGGDGEGGAIYRINSQGEISTLAHLRNPYALKVGGFARAMDGTIFGTATVGGDEGKGFLFRIALDGTFTQFESFGNLSGYKPRGICIDNAGVIRGIALRGGANGAGTIFKFVPGGALTAVVSFSASTGTEPTDHLLCASDGSFYGTTRTGGVNGSGTIFRLSADDQFVTLYSFSPAAGNALRPMNGLVETADGEMLGIVAGGAGGAEHSLFRVDRQGNLVIVGQVPQPAGLVYSAYSPLVAGPDGDFYAIASVNSAGDLMKMSTDGPVTRVATAYKTEALLLGSDGNFYGVAGSGVFRLTPLGGRSIIRNVPVEPTFPDVAGVVESGGSLYGVANGVVFRFPLSFKLSADSPIMTNITATIKASVENPQVDKAVTVHVEYGTTPAYGNATASEIIPPGQTRSVETQISELLPDTLYYFRVVATSNGVIANAPFEVRTHKSPPAVVITGAAQPQNYSATLNGTVHSPDGPVTVWFEFGEQPTSLKRHPSSQTFPAGPPQSFQRLDLLTNPQSTVFFYGNPGPLIPNTIYYFRAAAEFDGDDLGMAWSDRLRRPMMAFHCQTSVRGQCDSRDSSRDDPQSPIGDRPPRVQSRIWRDQRLRHCCRSRGGWDC